MNLIKNSMRLLLLIVLFTFCLTSLFCVVVNSDCFAGPSVPGVCTELPTCNTWYDNSLLIGNPGFAHCVVTCGYITEVLVIYTPSNLEFSQEYLPGTTESADYPLNPPPGTTDITITWFCVHYSGCLPVELSSFTGQLVSNGITLNWATQSESGLIGYNVYRNTSKSLTDAIRLNNVIISGTNTSTEQNYQFNDTSLETNENYYYWLESLEQNSTSEFHGPVFMNTQGAPGDDNGVVYPQLQVMSPYPNPFSSSSTLKVGLPTDMNVQVKIYNIKGELVKTLVNSNLNKGGHDLTWDGKNMAGKNTTSGVYFFKVSTPSEVTIKKVMHIKGN